MGTGYTGGSFDTVFVVFGTSSNARIIDEPVVVEGNRLKIDVVRMLTGRYYVVEYEGATQLVRKTEDSAIEFYELVETSE
ncbi:MAG: hypothetical protein QW304_07570 [Thermoproteota archaeon]